MIDKIKVKIEESPYGDTGAEYEGMLGMTQHYKLQLISFRSPNKDKKQSDFLEADIAGYDEILKSGSEENATNFYREKQRQPRRFKNNLAVIEHLKKEGLWK